MGGRKLWRIRDWTIAPPLAFRDVRDGKDRPELLLWVCCPFIPASEECTDHLSCWLAFTGSRGFLLGLTEFPRPIEQSREAVVLNGCLILPAAEVTEKLSEEEFPIAPIFSLQDMDECLRNDRETSWDVIVGLRGVPAKGPRWELPRRATHSKSRVGNQTPDFPFSS